MNRADRLSNLCTAETKPFQARGAFKVGTALDGISGQGQFAAQWNSPSEWRVEILIGNYHYIAVRNGNVMQHLPEGTHVPARVGWVLEHGLRDCFSHDSGDRRARLIGGAITVDEKRNEVYLEPAKQATTFKYWVIARDTGLLKRSTFTTYSNYQPFAEFLVPRQIDLIEFNRDAEQFKLLSLEESAPAPPNTFHLNGAAEITLQPHNTFTRPELIGVPHIELSPTARARVASFYVVIAYTIGTDGNVYDARTVISSGDTELDNSVLQSVKTFRYKPATEDGKPQPIEIEYTYGYGSNRKPWTSLR